MAFNYEELADLREMLNELLDRVELQQEDADRGEDTQRLAHKIERIEGVLERVAEELALNS